MIHSLLLTLLLPLLALASPWPQVSVTAASTTSCNETFPTTSSSSYSSMTTSTSTISAMLTITSTSTIIPSTTTPSWNSTTSSSSSSSPTTGAERTVPTSSFSVAGIRSGSAINLAPMVARGLGFWLSGETVAYCPFDSSDPRAAGCPPGVDTVFYGLCSMSVFVPGGQQVYAAPNGLVSYTQAHSVSMPPGSILCPFTYQKQDGDAFGTVSTNVFGARGLMACPTDDNQWQVFAAMPNATVPSGDVDDCVGFGALTYDYEEDGAAAFQYT